LSACLWHERRGLPPVFGDACCAHRYPRRRPPRRNRTPGGSHVPAQGEVAGHLRDEAKEACKGYKFLLCLEKLDEVRAIDPAGDGDPEVQALRKRATEELRPEPDKPNKPDKPGWGKPK
jgi:hypothetical protein